LIYSLRRVSLILKLTRLRVNLISLRIRSRRLLNIIVVSIILLISSISIKVTSYNLVLIVRRVSKEEK